MPAIKTLNQSSSIARCGWRLFPFMATPPISDGLKVEESARLLHAIFPNYPVLYPCRPTPPIEEWPLLIKADAVYAGPA